MTIIEMILEFAPAVDARKINRYLEWLDEHSILNDFNILMLQDTYNEFSYTFSDLTSGECKVVFGIWLATNRII